ncbi:MAG TPA: D-2-hydroxyacid dehydrogenase [Candidatus Limnocylindrales bacterium]|nr:D-2-hydroxyacid dehydrogenase [Candidatus Limnocylindrales bacterium]
MIPAKDDGSASPRFSKIVVLDGATLDPGDNSFEPVAELGPVEVYDRTPFDLVAVRARGADVILTNKTVLGADAFDGLPGLRLVCILATGVNVVDVAAATSHGVTVCNVPGYAAESVPQHVFALILEVTNAVGEHVAAVRDGEWAAAKDFSFWKRPLVELAGKTIGIVGHGAIGKRVGELAHAFGMHVLAYSPTRSNAPSYSDFAWTTVADLFARSDIVTLHCPLTPDNERFVDAALLATMKDGSILVNTARGALIDEVALAAALDAGRPSYAALDVLSTEPPPAAHPLASHPKAFVTPHIAWAALAARKRLMEVTVRNIRAFAEGRPQNVVR